MARRIIYLAELQPYNPALPGTVAVNFSDNLIDAAELGTANPYHVRLTQSFSTEIGVFDDNVPGGTSFAVGSITIQNADGAFDYLLGYTWDNRSLVVKKGYEGDAYASYTTVFTGATLECVAQGTTIVIALRDNSTVLTDVLQKNKFAGTGGVEGFVDLLGRRKPLCYGRVRNLLPIVIDTGLLIMQAHDGPIETVQAVYDRGNKLNVGTNYANYAALAAATVEPGYFATCTSLGLIRLGAKPVGTVTADVDGQYYALTVNNLPLLISTVMQTKGGISSSLIDLTSITAFTADAPYAYEGIYLPEPDLTVQEFLDNLVASLNGFWFISATGKITLRQFKFRTPVATVREEDIAEVRRDQSPAQLYSVIVDYSKNPTVQPLSDFPIPSGTLNGYLKDNIVYVQTDASGNGGSYTYSGKFYAFFNDQDATTLGNVQFRKLTTASWLTLAADGTFTVSDPGAGSGTYSPYNVTGLPITFTNEALWSRVIGASAWVKTNATTGDNTLVAPDGVTAEGTFTGDQIVFSAGTFGTVKQTVTNGTSVYRQFSVFVRSHAGSTGQPFRLFIQEGSGTITYSSTFTATGSWQRFVVQATFASASSAATFGFASDASNSAASLGVWQADYFQGYHILDGGPNIETTSAPRSLGDQGNGGLSYPLAYRESVTLEARVGEFAVQEVFTLAKRLSSGSTLILTPSVRRFYLLDNGTQSPAGQTSVITATGVSVGTLIWTAVTNTGVVVPLTGSGSSRTLAAADLPTSPLVQSVTVVAYDQTNRLVNNTKIIVQRGQDAYIASALGALAASNSSITLYYQTAQPSSGMTTNDMWIDTDDNNKLYVYNGTSWVFSSDTRISQALTDAAGAQATADGKIKTYLGTSAPTGTFALGDLWYNPTTFELKRWNGSSWSDVVSTVGAQIGVNLTNGGVTVSGPAIINSAVTITAAGSLLGAGGGTVTLGGLGDTALWSNIGGLTAIDANKLASLSTSDGYTGGAVGRVIKGAGFVATDVWQQTDKYTMLALDDDATNYTPANLKYLVQFKWNSSSGHTIQLFENNVSVSGPTNLGTGAITSLWLKYNDTAIQVLTDATVRMTYTSGVTSGMGLYPKAILYSANAVYNNLTYSVSQVQAQVGTNIVDGSQTVLGSTSLLNSAISINSSGVLSGAGGGTVTFSGLGGGAVGQQAYLVLGGTYMRQADGSTVLTNSTILNSAVSINSSGVLSGAGGGTVTFSGLGGAAVGQQAYLVLGGTYMRQADGSTVLTNGTILNSAITIGSNGALSGAGGGTVTITGLGYNGDLNANVGAVGDVNRVRFSRWEQEAIGWDFPGLVNAPTLNAKAIYHAPAVEFDQASVNVTFTASNQQVFIRPATAAVTNGDAQFNVPVTPGERIFISAEMWPQAMPASGRCYGWVVFHDQNNNPVAGGTGSVYGNILTTNPGNWSRQGGFFTVPTGAVFCTPFTVMDNLGSGATTTGSGSVHNIRKLMVCGAAPNQTTWPDFNPGPSNEAGAQISRWVDPPSQSLEFNYSYSGSPTFSTRSLLTSLKTAAGVISSGVTWRGRVISGGFNGATPSTGWFSPSGVSSGVANWDVSSVQALETVVEFEATFLGQIYTNKSTLKKIVADIPAGGGITTYANVTGFSPFGSSANVWTDVSGTISCALGGGSVTPKININLSAEPVSGSSLSFTCSLRLMIWNGASWVQIGGDATASSSYNFSDGPIPAEFSITFTDSSRTGTILYRIEMKCNLTRQHYPNGSVTVTS